MSLPTAKPWEHAKHGEGSSTDPLAARFVESLSFDTRLYDADIRGSIAHATMLAKVGLITQSDLDAITRGLGEIKREIEAAPAGPTAVGVPGAWPGWKFELEDVHMCVESALIAKIGDPGRKLHTGRSRNDQVALDLRLWLRDACESVARDLDAMLLSFRTLAREQGDIVLPSYTHLQRAQPIVVGAECMAWHSMFARDARFFRSMHSVEDALAASPLGSGAVAGSTLPLDRAFSASLLGFSGPSVSSIDATASRDEALGFLYGLTRTALHLSRLAEHWIIYCTTEFGFLSLGEAYTTGSSMMPQKRNPDMLELIRGKCGTIHGHFAALMMILKGLPLAYNRDLQEDKRHVFAAFDTLTDCVRIAAGIVASAKFKSEHISAGLDRGHLDATVLAEYFVNRGVPFRTAHQIVGSLVRACDQYGREALTQLSLDEFRSALKASGYDAGLIDRDVFSHLGAGAAVTQYRSAGHAGSSPGGYKDWLASFSDAPRASTPTHTARSPEPQTHSAAHAPAPNLFGAEDDTHRAGVDWSALIAAYEAAGRTLDDLPYTAEFDGIVHSAHAIAPGLTHREVFRRLHNLRKAGKLPRIGRAESTPVKLQPAEEAWLAQQVMSLVGSLGQRDQLPYDPRFDRLVESFNAHAGRTLDPHSVWRLIAKLAK